MYHKLDITLAEFRTLIGIIEATELCKSVKIEKSM